VQLIGHFEGFNYKPPIFPLCIFLVYKVNYVLSVQISQRIIFRKSVDAWQRKQRDDQSIEKYSITRNVGICSKNLDIKQYG